MAKHFSDLEIKVLSDLAKASDWKRPQELGGTTKSPHSRILRKLSDSGLAEKRRRSEDESKRSGYLYRITEEGRATLRREQVQGAESAYGLPERHEGRQPQGGPSI